MPCLPRLGEGLAPFHSQPKVIPADYWGVTGPALQASAPVRGLATALGLPLAAYRRDHVRDCIARVMRREQLTDLNALVARVDADPVVRTRLRRLIAVSTTGLFRDPSQLRWFDSAVMPSLTAGVKNFRAWSAGCAAGEEAFTIAMMLEWHGLLVRSEVVGSDILEESLAEGQSGVVGGARIPAGMRGRVTWDLRDLTSGTTPGGQFDLILCRNVMTFLTPPAAEGVARTLAGSLGPGGALLVAREERIEDPEALGLVAISGSAYRRSH
jgi:chemotaxis protein methyltransferase CheR